MEILLGLQHLINIALPGEYDDRRNHLIRPYFRQLLSICFRPNAPIPHVTTPRHSCYAFVSSPRMVVHTRYAYAHQTPPRTHHELRRQVRIAHSRIGKVFDYLKHLGKNKRSENHHCFTVRSSRRQSSSAQPFPLARVFNADQVLTGRKRRNGAQKHQEAYLHHHECKYW